MSVTFRQPTFKNPLPSLFNWIGKILMSFFVGIIAAGEQAGRARAASELARQGYYKESKALMLDK
jgi:hypothetical protein